MSYTTYIDATTDLEDISTEMTSTMLTTPFGGPPPTIIRPDIGGVLILIMIFSVTGNCFVISVIFAKMGGLNRIINCMVLSLAFADVMQQIFLNFPLAYTNLRGVWDIGIFFCKSHSWIRSSAVIASVYTLVAIGIER